MRNSYTIQLIYKIIYEIFIVLILLTLYYYGTCLEANAAKLKELGKQHLANKKLQWSIQVLETLLILQLIVVFARVFSIYAEPHYDNHNRKLYLAGKISVLILAPTVIFLMCHLIYQVVVPQFHTWKIMPIASFFSGSSSPNGSEDTSLLKADVNSVIQFGEPDHKKLSVKAEDIVK